MPRRHRDVEHRCLLISHQHFRMRPKGASDVHDALALAARQFMRTPLDFVLNRLVFEADDYQAASALCSTAWPETSGDGCSMGRAEW